MGDDVSLQIQLACTAFSRATGNAEQARQARKIAEALTDTKYYAVAQDLSNEAVDLLNQQGLNPEQIKQIFYHINSRD